MFEKVRQVRRRRSPLLFPRTRDFMRLFDRSTEKTCITIKEGVGGPLACLYSHLQTEGMHSGKVLFFSPKLKVAEAVARRVVVHDSMYLRVIPQTNDPKTGLVLYQYNKILGSIWLAYVDMKTVPRR